MFWLEGCSGRIRRFGWMGVVGWVWLGGCGWVGVVGWVWLGGCGCVNTVGCMGVVG